MNKQITCIICPNGCELSVEWENQSIKNISGALCKRGKEYAAQEVQNPKRTIASLVKVTNGEIPLVSVRTTKAVPKEKIFDVMKEIKKLEINAPVKINQVIVKNILGLDSDIIATKFVEKKISNF
jgi:CxxC motif-containing protein